MRPLRLPILFVTGLALCCAAAAEVGVSGKIVDENGLAVAFAKVEARATPSSPAAAAISDIAGGFSLQLAAPGEYLVHAQRPGFFVFGRGAEGRDGSKHIHITLDHLQGFFPSGGVSHSGPTNEPS